jgi:hypothetical protein
MGIDLFQFKIYIQPDWKLYIWIILENIQL